MRVKQIAEQYHISYRHNPKQFVRNSFQVETEGDRLVLVAVVKRHIKKRFRIVGILKPRRN
jgi:hypothetical protein